MGRVKYRVTSIQLTSLCVLLFLVFATQGCSTASWIVNPPPHISDLYMTEDDVVEYFGRISKQEPSDPDAVLYNPETDRYEVKAPTYKKALTKSVMYEIQKEKIIAFSRDYHRETFGKAVKKDLGTAGIWSVIIAVAIAVFSGL